MAVFHEEVHAVVLVADGVFLDGLGDDFEVLHANLKADGAPLVLADSSRDGEGGLLRQMVGPVEDLFGDVALEDDALDDARAVAHLEEVELSLGAAVVEPALEGDFLSGVLGDVGDIDVLSHGVFLVCKCVVG